MFRLLHPTPPSTVLLTWAAVFFPNVIGLLVPAWRVGTSLLFHSSSGHGSPPTFFSGSPPTFFASSPGSGRCRPLYRRPPSPSRVPTPLSTLRVAGSGGLGSDDKSSTCVHWGRGQVLVSPRCYSTSRGPALVLWPSTHAAPIHAISLFAALVMSTSPIPFRHTILGAIRAAVTRAHGPRRTSTASSSSQELAQRALLARRIFGLFLLLQVSR